MKVRAKLLGWDEASASNAADFPDPELPSYEGLSAYVTGELKTQPVHVPEAGIHYIRHTVGGHVVDLETVQTVSPKTSRYAPGLKVYNPDQPRDADGRFGSGGGDQHFAPGPIGGPTRTIHADGTYHEGPRSRWTEENRRGAGSAGSITPEGLRRMGFTRIDALPRENADDPIDPHLGTIERRASAFYADPANKTEVMARGDPRLVGLHNEANELMTAAQASGAMDNSDEGRRLYEGMNYLRSAVRPTATTNSVVVATHDGHLVAAIDFDRSRRAGRDVLEVNLLGSTGTQYGAATALQHELASYGASVGAVRLTSEATLDAVPYHQSIGRVLSGRGQFPESTWSAEDMAKIAALPVRPSSA